MDDEEVETWKAWFVVNGFSWTWECLYAASVLGVGLPGVKTLAPERAYLYAGKSLNGIFVPRVDLENLMGSKSITPERTIAVLQFLRREAAWTKNFRTHNTETQVRLSFIIANELVNHPKYAGHWVGVSESLRRDLYGMAKVPFDGKAIRKYVFYGRLQELLAAKRQGDEALVQWFMQNQSNGRVFKSATNEQKARLAMNLFLKDLKEQSMVKKRKGGK